MYFFSLTLPLLLFAAENRTARRCFLRYFMRFPKKLLNRLLLLSLAVYVIYVLWGRRFLDAWRYHRAVRAQREHLEVDVKRYRLQVATKRYFIRKLMTDADFREQVLREQIDYVGEDEYAIYFREEGEHLSNMEKNAKNF